MANYRVSSAETLGDREVHLPLHCSLALNFRIVKEKKIFIVLFTSSDKHREQMSEVQQCSRAIHPEVHTKPGCTLQASVGKRILPAQKE